MKSTSSYSEENEKIHKNLEKLKNIELPLASDELESFFEESDIANVRLLEICFSSIFDINFLKLTLSQKDNYKKESTVCDIIENQDFNGPE
ncbi:hypothetical protein PCK2_000784 [Pneumocystis canis]|nr:hypothetical protein PCK2_000784 [Pneumocystis canis]